MQRILCCAFAFCLCLLLLVVMPGLARAQYTGCDVVTQSGQSKYVGTGGGLGISHAFVCANSEVCETHQVWACGQYWPVQICFWSNQSYVTCDWKVAMRVTHANPTIACGGSAVYFVNCTIPTGTHGWVVCDPTVACSGIPMTEEDVESEILDDANNQWLENRLDDWENGGSYTHKLEVECIC